MWCGPVQIPLVQSVHSHADAEPRGAAHSNYVAVTTPTSPHLIHPRKLWKEGRPLWTAQTAL
jgi:hypothetical protein